MLMRVNPLHLFTLGGIPVFASPFYVLLLLMFARGGSLLQGVVWALCITLSLLVHEFGHALVAKHLRHDPSIMLHGFGGLTSRSRSGRDVEEAAIVATGPAAGLALGLVVFGAWQLLVAAGLATPLGANTAYALLYPCITWNLLNLIPLWPLDGGQLFRIGLGRWLGPQRGVRITHVLSLLVVAGLALWALHAHSIYSLVILAMLGMQNIQAMRGQAARTASVAVPSGLSSEYVEQANRALSEGQFKEAARLAHQARAQDGVTPALVERIWEIAGLATVELGEPEEALSYLRRARPNERVREATQRCLSALGREDELTEIRTRWASLGRGRYMSTWLVGALGFIVIAIGVVFTTSLSGFVF
jgi:stage IV sporulation protein FB